ncbi:MAG TPA: sulfite exporter TauE/SafE family protein [Accumulibacter sp.]|uniref:sulfite exporter TauE/SafE family protein n=5 Tax=Accumulibacter sp. TaxID=2053492 RepID=UPI0026021E16|nr:sulfite exporter TauE/SafE family protein [Accumulibacter sp.]MDS4055433.1 sulfite exporter TauE/SafE family protein [Accumulibacter sp.]HMW64542.1 sulfite exporter TauE/SafE family protein [Accumulibacter sp.]HMW80464.1 sulfite exporter TauE/SafE family protein [Accumulibacter sp.]HNB66588.1 sulfite exporter TauE/SafE family protein [Accumulibacter sp.]HNC25491.1 sulfite exporter TauE/SafE family protein [Accumulibacter sp.]
MIWWLAYTALGVFTGFFAGMLGIGGGLVMVPTLTLMFAAQAAFPATEVLHLALGTSMATILFTALASLRAHHRHGAVLWPVVAQITPGILLGTLLGTLFAASVPARPLALFFTGFVCLIALQMILDIKPKPSRELPGTGGVLAVGTGIGAISALVAIGGGSLTVPFLTWCNVRVQNAIGTSAAVGFPIALGGSLGYIVNGWEQPGLPAWSLGYIYLPAFIWLVPASMLSAPLGASLAHRLPVRTLKRLFAGILILLAAKMSWGIFA